MDEVIITLGGVVKPGTARKNKTGSWKVFRPVVDHVKCILCMRCVNYCPEPCISVKEEKILMNYEYCKGCGICREVCPVEAIVMEYEKKG